MLLTEYNEEETREYLRREAIEEGLEKGLKASIEICQELNLSKEDTLARIARKFSLEEAEIQKYIEIYWNMDKNE